MLGLTRGASSGRIPASAYRAYRVPMTEVQQSSNGQVIARAGRIVSIASIGSENIVDWSYARKAKWAGVRTRWPVRFACEHRK